MIKLGQSRRTWIGVSVAILFGVTLSVLSRGYDQTGQQQQQPNYLFVQHSTSREPAKPKKWIVTTSNDGKSTFIRLIIQFVHEEPAASVKGGQLTSTRPPLMDKFLNTAIQMTNKWNSYTL